MWRVPTSTSLVQSCVLVDDALTRVEYGRAASSPGHQSLSVSRLMFEETLVRLKQAIAEEDLWLIHEIDPQALLRRTGHGIHPTRQLLFFHPRFMTRLLTIDPNALIEVPLKLVVMEMPDGTVTVRHPRIDVLLGRYDGLHDMANELASSCRRLVQTVVVEPTEVTHTSTLRSRYDP